MELDGKVTIVLDTGPTDQALPSTIVDCTRETLHILRQGPIELQDLYLIDTSIEWVIS